ncbi:ZrgA family zinc uptake protein [Tropicibacter naphthalenivorans]|uniref:DUF2796 domain-containing protein n=1 Tax=Tropicibacter naphthalenivorans TaxID=441103 RepID=A0A0P1GHX2_9RHOB|nr:DUF2796 domain-containing protein [Tropicibacter naphthalenivorans]CUH80997.1 hypothetical protein TRN7648_03280 [Tropicibacter naphthalenivorans]SMC91811.1 Protein of unknown function [Tropicibacter naphthalenivorans]
MKPIHLALAVTALASPALAQEAREMDAHEHGVSVAEIAVEHGKVAINITAPGMDIVGFEYEAASTEDKDAVEAAIRALLTPEAIVALPEAAGCRLTEVLAHLHGGDHDDTADAHMDDDHDDHDDAAHEDHDDHADAAQHTEFHVSYAFACEDEDALTQIGFPFFDQFANAQEIDAQYVTETGAGLAEITRAAPTLTLE